MSTLYNSANGRHASLAKNQIDFVETNLYDLCERISNDPGENPEWGILRSWLDSHTSEEAVVDITLVGEHSALHLICEKNPPLDIIQKFIEATKDPVFTTELNGYLPLHIAAANGASEEVISLLVKTFPESTAVTDHSGRTPLHFAVMNTSYDLTASLTTTLSSNNATQIPDETGKLPLHYACAYGTSKEALQVLTTEYDAAMMKYDVRGFIPFHFALSNCKPIAIQHIISLDPNIVNAAVEGKSRQHPLSLLGRRAASKPRDKQLQERVKSCLDIFMKAEPKPTADFITVLQSLPESLRDNAVVNPYVINVLNKKISGIFHTAFMIYDFVFLVLTIMSFAWGVTHVLRFEGSDKKSDRTIAIVLSASLYMSASYFLFRELVQAVSLAYLGYLKSWFTDASNWVDLVCISLSLFWATYFLQLNIENYAAFRYLASVTTGVYLIWLFDNLRSVFLSFAVFIEGLLYVFKRLATFLMNLVFILIAFSYMFYVLFMISPQCASKESIQTATAAAEFTSQDTSCPEEASDDEDTFYFCDFGQALIFNYSMLLGEVEDDLFYGNTAAMVLFAVYMFLVVILLANVLIAIVTDSYGVIKKQRATIVFWNNRLDFVAEIDVIEERLWEGRFYPWFRNIRQDIENRLEEKWDELTSKVGDQQLFLAAISWFCIGAWLFIGFMSAGLLWPPQVRENLLKKSYNAELKKSDHQTIEVEALEKEINDLRTEFRYIVAEGNKEATAMKTQILAMKEAVTVEIEAIKEITSELFDLQETENNNFD